MANVTLTVASIVCVPGSIGVFESGVLSAIGTGIGVAPPSAIAVM